MDKWFPGFEGVKTPGDLGWKHGTEDIGGSFKYRPGCLMTKDQYEEYKDAYKEARRNWD